jgi:uncharacterized Zn finger protein
MKARCMECGETFTGEFAEAEQKLKEHIVSNHNES